MTPTTPATAIRYDIANLAVFLGVDESRCITGQQIGVDAGAFLKWEGGLPS
jgi:enoyl-[acyl-carrier-protein] reductase (NADH)